MILTGDKAKHLEKKLSYCQFIYKRRAMDTLAGLCEEKSATNRLNYGRVTQLICARNIFHIFCNPLCVLNKASVHTYGDTFNDVASVLDQCHRQFSTCKHPDRVS